MTSEHMPNWLMQRAALTPERIAVFTEQEQWTFAELNRRVIRQAKLLLGQGVKSGDHIGLLCQNGLHVAEMVHALSCVGAVLVPLNTRLSVRELVWQAEDARLSYLYYDAATADKAEQMKEQFFSTTRSPSPAPEILLLSDLKAAQKADPDTLQKQALLSDIPKADALQNRTTASDMSVVDWVKNPKPFSTDANTEPFNQQLKTEPHFFQTEFDLTKTHTIMYTSGTTGRPKGVQLTYGNHWWSAVGSSLNLGLQEGDSWLACLPLYHIGGLSILLRGVIYGIPVMIQEKFDPHAVNEAIVRQRVSIISVVSAMLARMVEQLGDTAYPESLRCVLLGGGPAPQSLLETCAQKNIPVFSSFGMTETASQTVTLTPEHMLRKQGSAGKPLFPVQLQIKKNDHLASAGEAGEIHIKGPNVMQGYWQREEATAEAMHNGWLKTGDIGYVDEEGFLYVLERRTDLIISGGENVYPSEIESVLHEHEDIVEAGVTGIEDEIWGQVPIAFVKTKGDREMDEEDIQSFCRKRLAAYKVPTKVYQVAALPRNATNKLLRKELLKLI